jgi:hypothetical protein
MQLTISPTGRVTGIYDEAFDLALLGPLIIRRASHVEPDSSGRWFADLSPVSGPTLGPFRVRSDALAAERSWLDADHGSAWMSQTITHTFPRLDAVEPESGGPRMGARSKLNEAYVTGAFVLAVVLGLLFQSFTVFIVTFVIVVILACVSGDIRPGPPPHRRRFR